MINPNICKRVRVDVMPCGTKATYRGHELDINRGTKRPGSRYCWLKYSILLDQYYLTASA